MGFLFYTHLTNKTLDETVVCCVVHSIIGCCLHQLIVSSISVDNVVKLVSLQQSDMAEQTQVTKLSGYCMNMLF